MFIIGTISAVYDDSVPSTWDIGANDDVLKHETFLRANNQDENKTFAAAIRACERAIGRELNEDQIERVHRAISKQGYGYHEFLDECIAMFD
ncbi:unnamed protein product [Rotaria sp. Silwood2]|nr:unnamed protein product [Rotaria sp. Silwood2]CAF3159209.1 unnamed protein product [Rotaria sp. Silwood2]CAF3374187.1 unnamed protein product [Rotaria sp. Silwood2]CAF4483828.1 unnamed protein product [Rotaria sp. Silwood2]CAF4505620.1 unnamed protein product [Rotaria sp. Silwood2]